MKTLDISKPVLVTGATGYVAGWLIKKLLEEGFTVHATVRNPDNKAKLAHLDSIAAASKGTIKYFKADLLEQNAFFDAMQGCSVVFHTASPFSLDVKNPQKQLIEPAVLGTENVLNAVNKTPSVERVVLTSSCAAIYTDCSDLESTPKGIFTEDVWNTTASLDYQPYSYSKTLAEQKAWAMNKAQSHWDLVVVNPSMVVGPPLNPKETTSESIHLFQQMGDGTFKTGVPNLGMGIVDVRDLANAHYLAAFTPAAEGRHIISGHNSSFGEMAQILYAKYGKTHKIPKRNLPKWLLMLIGPIVNKALTWKFIRNNVNKVWKADNSKSKTALGLTYMPLADSLYDTFESLKAAKMV
jgi:nucleoside-diphosphate-sugar epimerase